MTTREMFNGTKVLQWVEFFDLLKYLEVPQGEEIKCFQIEFGMSEDVIYINDKIVKRIKHWVNNGTWLSKEYKALCEKLCVLDIETSTGEILTIAENEAVSVTVSYMPFKKVDKIG